MKKQEKIIKNVQSDKELMKTIAKVNIYTEHHFYDDAVRYIKAIKDNRMVCIIPHVSSSGMSRIVKFHECKKIDKTSKYRYYNFFAFFLSLGYTPDRSRFGFKVNGCGMDMVFHTNYTIIHRLGRLGFLNKKEVDTLAQQTPEVL